MTREEKYKIIQKELDSLYPNPKTELNYTTPWEFLVAVILSARNTDKKVNEVTAKLFQKYKTLNAYRKATLPQFEKDISQIGLYRSKAKNIKATADIIGDKYDGKIPDSMEKLIELPGVGRKTANVMLAELYGKPEGVVVDTHVARLSQEFGLTTEKAPEKIEKDLMTIVPESHWRRFPLQLILYGRYYHKANSKSPHPLEKFVTK